MYQYSIVNDQQSNEHYYYYYLPLWAWCYMCITGIIFICTLITLCYIQKWLCFKQILQNRWCIQNSVDMHTGLCECTDNNGNAKSQIVDSTRISSEE
ncbi:hypothetical protein KSF78_0006745 [Schistosoma japonicum]|nr:hypothetical protein KSF78_0006745 [Schistosoma japonicum]